MPEGPWSVRLLGAMEAHGHGKALSRWPSRAVAALLARLALAPDRAHPREELIELLWPGVALEVGRNRLRQALSTLKSLLESSSTPVLLADRMSIRVQPGSLDCDARRFERLLRAGQAEAARELYRGELMPGFYDDWVIDERLRLDTAFERCCAAALPAQRGESAAPDPVAAPTGLPGYWTRAYGIDLTSSRLSSLVRAQRLVTVHGPGGSGKTRLAVEVAQALHHAPRWSVDGETTHFDRIVFVPLVDCSDPTQALETIAEALQADGKDGARENIIAALSGRQALLVLDNLEQLADSLGPALVRLLSTLPQLHVLITSRRLLELEGEHAFELQGLALPAATASPADAANNPAVALFVDRARAARADFGITARNAEAIGALVHLLGGMPLAIELAATRVRSLTPHELLQRLSADAGTPMLDLLARRSQRASTDQRHASMRHVVAWSWQQLPAGQAAMLATLSVFGAPARIEAIAAVAALDLHTAQSLVHALLDGSLVRATEDADGAVRCVLLQPVREFAAERLAPAEARAARHRLRQWLTTLAVAGKGFGQGLAASEAAHVHAAIVSAPADQASREGLELAVALRPCWDTDNLPRSDVLALEQALADLGPEPVNDGLRADALELLAHGRASTGYMTEALAHADAALASATDDSRRSRALVRRVTVAYNAGLHDTDFDTALSEAGTLARRSGDLSAQAAVLRMQALVACNFRLDFAQAERLSAQSQQIWEQLGNPRMAQARLLDRAVNWAWQGQNAKALTVLDECERAAIADANDLSLAVLRWQKGRVLVRMRRWDEAVAAFRGGLAVAWRRHYAQALAYVLLSLPDALVMNGQVDAAARLQGFAVAHWTRHYKSINPISAREIRRTRLLLHCGLGAARAECLRAEGVGMGVVAAVSLAMGNTVE